MKYKATYDISEVCNMLGTTSRTLRFYEKRGIIKSTTVGTSARRRYTDEQLSNIRNVFVLRALGLSINSIAELQNKEIELKKAVISKRAEIYASIDARIREIALLNDALAAIESGKDIFSQEWQYALATKNEEKCVSEICAHAIINGDTETLYKHLSTRLVQYMPREAYEVVRKDTLSAVGGFVAYDKTSVDRRYPNKLYHFVKFSRIGLKITFVFHGGKIDGLWLGYYDLNERKVL